MISSGAAKPLYWSDTSQQTFTRDVTTEVRLIPAALQVTLPVPDEQAAATMKILKWLWHQRPKPCLESSGPEVSPSNELPTADEVTRSLFALFYLPAAPPPRAMLALCSVVSCLCLYHMQIQVILGVRLKSEVSQTDSLSPTYLVQGWRNNPWSFWKP